MKTFILHLSEKITASTPTGEVIRDFIKSKAPQFKGKSKKERIRMALGAKYAMMRNEEHSIKILLTKEEVNYIHSMIAEGKVKKQNKKMKNWVIKTAMTQGMSPRPRGSEATKIARKKYSEMNENKIFISLSEAGPVKRENKAKAREYMRGLGTTLRYRLKKTPYNPHGDMGPHTKWMHDDNAEGDVRRGRGVHKSNMAARTTDRLTNAIYHRTHSIENSIKMDWAERRARLASYGKNQNERTKKVAFDNLPSHLKKIGSVSRYGSRFTGYKKQTEE